jgi:hypothetical protein
MPILIFAASLGIGCMFNTLIRIVALPWWQARQQRASAHSAPIIPIESFRAAGNGTPRVA